VEESDPQLFPKPVEEFPNKSKGLELFYPSVKKVFS
jgi:hypothetical protein